MKQMANLSSTYLPMPRGLVASVNGGVWGTVVAFNRVGKKGSAEADGEEGGKGAANYVVDVLVNTQGQGPLAVALAQHKRTNGECPMRLALLQPQAKRLEPEVVSLPLSQVRSCPMECGVCINRSNPNLVLFSLLHLLHHRLTV